MVQAGDDLAALLLAAIADQGLTLGPGDVLAVAQKVVSKAEGRLVWLSAVAPSAAAITLARETDKDPRLVQLILDESTEVLRKKPGVLIVRHRLGIVGAHAGIDQSNIEHGAAQADEAALLLPADPDASAAGLRDAILGATGQAVGVIITDSANRPWRLGTVGIAIGLAGVQALDDRRGDADLFGREMNVTLVNRADGIAALATLAMGETTEATPAALVRGLGGDGPSEPATAILRPLADDLFR